jgi:hypothetical protein
VNTKQQSITINADLIKERLDVQEKSSTTREISKDAAVADELNDKADARNNVVPFFGK